MMLEWLAPRLHHVPPDAPLHDDRHDVESGLVHPATGLTRAAVLVPVILRDQPVLLFTRRTERLARHSGQVSFPGGRSEPHDRSPAETALRETMEETGIAPGFVRVAGYLDRYVTGTGFDIQPVVGLVQNGFALTPDPAEVADIFEVPLAFLRDPGNAHRQTRLLGGHERSFHVFRYQDHEIWGATAAIVMDLVARLHGIEAP